VVATRPKQWTCEDLCRLPERRYEIIAGELVKVPAPKEARAIAVMNLIALFQPGVRATGGKIFTAPIDLNIVVLVLRGGDYQSHVRATGDVEATSTVLPNLPFPASAAFT
jgi:hypothetical protein